MDYKRCNLLVPDDNSIMINKITDSLMGNDVAAKVSAMKCVVALGLNGEDFVLWKIYTTVLRYVFPSENLTILKLILLYFEIVGKGDGFHDPVVPPGVNLLCRYYFCKKLNHPDWYVRGVTLRFLCRMLKAGLLEPDQLEPLVDSVLPNLDHEDHFVRCHALSAVSAIYHLPDGRTLIPDAPGIAERALATEQDAAARRNAFLMLCALAQQRAVAYLLANADGLVTEWPDLLQVVAIDFIHGVCRSSSNHNKDTFIKIITSLLSSPSDPVVYKCASALLSLTPDDPTVVRAAASAYCKLLSSQSDDSKVKLVVLDRLHELCISHRDVVSDLIMDVLHATASPSASTDPMVVRAAASAYCKLLSSQSDDSESEVKLVVPNCLHELRIPHHEVVSDLLMDVLHATASPSVSMDVKRMVLGLVMYLRTRRNVEKVVRYLKDELVQTQAGEYRQLLVQGIHACGKEYPEMVRPVVPLIMDYVGDKNTASALKSICSCKPPKAMSDAEEVD